MYLFLEVEAINILVIFEIRALLCEYIFLSIVIL